MTKHADQRMKERLGIQKCSLSRVEKNALKRGKSHRDFTGKMRKHLDGLYLSRGTANNMKVYQQSVFLFENENLITVIKLPNRLKKLL